MIAVNGRTVDAIVEEIEGTAPDTIFYIGSQNGFFFIGDVNEYKAEIENISNKYLKYFKTQVTKANKTISDGLKPIQIDKAKDEPVEKYVNRLAGLAEALKQALRTKEKLIPYIESYKPFMQRIPTEVFKKDEILDQKGVVINLKGIEQGAYWFKSEYDKDKKRR